jgi:hypothetical protein
MGKTLAKNPLSILEQIRALENGNFCSGGRKIPSTISSHGRRKSNSPTVAHPGRGAHRVLQGQADPSGTVIGYSETAFFIAASAGFVLLHFLRRSWCGLLLSP